MANAARIHTLERGKDPHRFPVFAFGGAGPVHGFRVAQALGSPALIVPLGAGVMSAVGFLTAPLAFDFVRSWPGHLQDIDWRRVNILLGEMEAEGQAVLEQSGLSPEKIQYRREADIRYVGQGHEIRVPLPSGQLDSDSAQVITLAFEEVYQRLYERLSLAVPIEIINWRVTASGPKPEVHLQMPDHEQKTSQSAQKGSRPVYFPGGYRDVVVYDRYLLSPGTGFMGPAIVEERESTVIVGEDCNCLIDGQWNMIIDLAQW
jgi:N-methylhydantoinase A